MGQNLVMFLGSWEDQIFQRSRDFNHKASGCCVTMCYYYWCPPGGSHLSCAEPVQTGVVLTLAIALCMCVCVCVLVILLKYFNYSSHR